MAKKLNNTIIIAATALLLLVATATAIILSNRSKVTPKSVNSALLGEATNTIPSDTSSMLMDFGTVRTE